MTVISTCSTDPTRSALAAANGEVALIGPAGKNNEATHPSSNTRGELILSLTTGAAAPHAINLSPAPRVLQLPFGTSDSDFGSVWPHLSALSPSLHAHLEAGGRLVLHTQDRADLAATVAAAILAARGVPLDAALSRISLAWPGASPSARQRRALAEKFPRPSATARLIRACLLGGAIGDAMGAEMEFWPLARMRARFPEGIDHLLPHQGLTGAITDDTQMTLFTTEGLIRALRRFDLRGICHPPSVIHHAYLRWLATQGEEPHPEICGTGLITEQRLRHRRAPGTTCLTALRQSRAFGERARNTSKGCGAIMRTAPLAFAPTRDVATLAGDCAALTHGHPTGQAAAAAFSAILKKVSDGTSLEKSIDAAGTVANSETRQAIRNALRAPRDGTPETVETLGGGWVAEETLAIALYAALCATNFTEGLKIAVLHSGDSDSTAAIAGNLLGLLYPDEVHDHPFADQIECRDLIETLSRDLSDALEPRRHLSDTFDARYPGW